MRSQIQSFPNSFLETVRMMNQMKLNEYEHPIHHVVIAGIGISGIAANLAESFINHEIRVPLKVINGFRIPAFVNENTLFIANSFSGNTEETLEQLNRAIKKSAKVVCISTGGKMYHIAFEHNLDFVKIPGGSMGIRRLSLGYSVFLILHVLANFKLISNAFINQILDTHRFLISVSRKIELKGSEIADKIGSKFLFIYGSVKIESVVLRAQQQINENAKQLCHSNYFPELNHNEIEGWENPLKMVSNGGMAIILRHTYEHPLTAKGIEDSKQVIVAGGIEILEIKAEGNTFMEQCFYLIHLFDWISFFIAEKNKVDPLQINVINRLKEKLNER
ncbi:MAG: bifunctional phosphoglucose/phosphomannose isomerase [Bacteroidota bacterium]|nr:bifunctional phosphoglucose/phosphomannose isomerase [Bacteroidota bacterium]